jgi:hypothetical protein
MKKKHTKTERKGERVGFSITGEFITNHARERWQERNYAGAFKLLECLIGMTREQQEDILFGRARLAGVNNVDLLPDSWVPPEGYASLHEALQQGAHADELARYKEDHAWRLINEEWTSVVMSKEGRARLFRGIASLVGEEKAERMLDQHVNELADRHADAVRGRTLPDEDPVTKERPSIFEIMPSPEAMEHRGHNIKPVLDERMESPCGWLLPDGKYYGCGSMEHIGLAATLLKDQVPRGKDAEKHAEDLGWCKVTVGAGGLYVHGRKLTARQRTKLFDYGEVHKRDMKKKLQDMGFDEAE